MTVNRREASAARRAALLALLLAACFALSTLVALRLPLVDPDEGRNAEVAREMAVSGDLVVPHLAGMPYLDKPPGFFWAAALSIRALGPTPLAARLPSVLASLATLALVGAAARRAGGDRLALIAVALLAAAPLYAALSAYVIFDMPLTLCVTVVWQAVQSGFSLRWARCEKGAAQASAANQKSAQARMPVPLMVSYS